MDWVRLIFFKAIRVTIGFSCGVFLVWLFGAFGHGAPNFSVGAFVDYVTAMLKPYGLLIGLIWLVLVVVEVVRDRNRPGRAKRARSSSRPAE